MASGDERTIANWFNRACVAAPTDPSQPFGNAERNSVRGPLFWQFDLVGVEALRSSAARRSSSSGSKRSISSTARTSARPNGNRSAAAFGTITSTYDPRQLQLGFKLLW